MDFLHGDSLYEVIQSAYKSVSEEVNGRSIKLIQLNSWNDEPDFEVVTLFDEKYQNLSGILVTLMDQTSHETFTQEELKTLMGFTTDHHSLGIVVIDHESLSEYVCKLAIVRRRLFNAMVSEFQEDPIDRQIFSELGNMFDLNMKRKKRAAKYGMPKEIDTSKVPEAYKWIISKGFTPFVLIKGENEREVELREIVSTDGEKFNRFRLSDNGKPGPNSGMSVGQVENIENHVNLYRDTDLTKMTFLICGYDLFNAKN